MRVRDPVEGHGGGVNKQQSTAQGLKTQRLPGSSGSVNSTSKSIKGQITTSLF